MTKNTEFDHFAQAQDRVWPKVIAELEGGRKATHWMWYVFPQLASLGRSRMSQRFGLADLAEAQAYLAHPVLGPRLAEAAAHVLSHPDRAAEAIMGNVDALKLRSSMTLFSRVPGADPVFQRVLETFYDGKPCPLTLDEIDAGG